MTAPPINSQRVPPCSARASRSDSVHHWSDRDKLHDNIAGHGSVATQPRDELCQNLTDQAGTVVLIGISGCGIAVPFKFYSFIHPAVSS